MSQASDDELDEMRREILDAEDSEFWIEESEEDETNAETSKKVIGEHKILGYEKIMTLHAFDVEKAHLVLPDGRERYYDLVGHGPAVVMIPVTSDGHVLFVKQFRIGAEKKILELPAGVLNKGENPDIAAERELREETGFASDHIQRIGGFFASPGYCSEYLNIYYADNLTPSPLPQDDDEFISLVSLTVDEVYEAIETGAFVDSKTYAALALADRFLRPLRSK